MMEYEKSTISGNVQILKRKPFEGIAKTIDFTGVEGDVVKAGTPIAEDGSIFEVEGGTKGVYTVQITTAFAKDEVVTIEGVDYTCAEAEDVESNEFAGANAAAQVTSLLKMVTSERYDVASVAGATDKIGFTQKEAIGAEDAPTASTEATTGAIGDVTKVTDPVAGVPNVFGILLNDVAKARPQGTVLKKAYINTSVAEANCGVEYTDAIKATVPMIVFE